jgi:hypothetical protein
VSPPCSCFAVSPLITAQPELPRFGEGRPGKDCRELDGYLSRAQGPWASLLGRFMSALGSVAPFRGGLRHPAYMYARKRIGWTSSKRDFIGYGDGFSHTVTFRRGVSWIS